MQQYPNFDSTGNDYRSPYGDYPYAKPTLRQKVKETYWLAKKTVTQKIGVKEDEHVQASDAELDQKLELFYSIKKSCADFVAAIGQYQDIFCRLSKDEHCISRFLKSKGDEDDTRAGNMMKCVGQVLSYTATQRLNLREPLLRLYKDVDTFRSRAVTDCEVTVKNMEACRTKYRASLLWMKSISENQLDPEQANKLHNFRKVQDEVKKAKAKFDKYKLDTMQKIDLLAASRCNLYSAILAPYQNALLAFWSETSVELDKVQEAFKGYQYYEFTFLKELAEPSQKLMEDHSKETTNGVEEKESGEDDDKGLIQLDSVDSDHEQDIPTQEETNNQDQNDLLFDEVFNNITSPETENAEGPFTFTKSWESTMQMSETPPSTNELPFNAIMPSSIMPSSILDESSQQLKTNSTTKTPTAPPQSPDVEEAQELRHCNSVPASLNKNIFNDDSNIKDWYNFLSSMDPLAESNNLGIHGLGGESEA